MDTHESLRQICNLLKRQVNKDFEELGLTFSQSGILMFIVINKDKKMNQRDIEKEFDLTNPTVTGIINRLETKGLIKRKNDSIDKRVKNIIATEKALMFLDLVIQKRKKLEESMLKNINKEEIDTFCNVLNKIMNNLKETQNERDI